SDRVAWRGAGVVRVSPFGGVFEAKVDLTTFSFQVPAEVSSAGDFACETIATRDSTDAMMRVFRANIDFIPRVIHGSWSSARRAHYTPVQYTWSVGVCRPPLSIDPLRP